MNPTPRKGQRWSWDYDKRDIKSRCIVEVISAETSWVRFKYVQIVYTNYTEKVGQDFGVSPATLNDNCDGIFTYLEGQDTPQ